MTAQENTLLEKMRDELHEYHTEVSKLIAEFDTCSNDVEIIKLDLYGNPKDRETNPGIMSHISDLRKTRRTTRLILGGAWTIATILIGALVSYIMRSE
jgi:hypothetical protein